MAIQVLLAGHAEAIYTEFKDVNGNRVDPTINTLPNITVYDINGNFVTDAATGATLNHFQVSTQESKGVWYYVLTLPADAFPGYYSAWWEATLDQGLVTQDIPQVFKVMQRKVATFEAVVIQMARDKLLMNFADQGARNKFVDDSAMRTYAQNSLDDFNFTPPLLTAFTFSELPSDAYLSLLADGAFIAALVSLEVLEAGKHFSYSDNGISITRDRSTKYHSIWGQYMTSYIAQKTAIKKQLAMSLIKPQGLFSSVVGYPRSLDRALRGTHKFRT